MTDPLARITYWTNCRWDYTEAMVGGQKGIRLIVGHPATGGEIASPSKVFGNTYEEHAAKLALVEWARGLEERDR